MEFEELEKSLDEELKKYKMYDELKNVVRFIRLNFVHFIKYHLMVPELSFFVVFIFVVSLA